MPSRDYVDDNYNYYFLINFSCVKIAEAITTKEMLEVRPEL